MHKVPLIFQSLQILQNDMIRLILGYRRKDHKNMKAAIEELKMMSVNEMACYHILIETNNILFHSSSEQLKEKFLSSQRQNVCTRSKERGDLNVPRVNKKSCEGFMLFAPKLWNKLPVNMRSIQSKTKFKTAVKEWIKDGHIPD